jgi:hypothetical protein
VTGESAPDPRQAVVAEPLIDAFHRFAHNGQCRTEPHLYSTCDAYQRGARMARLTVPAVLAALDATGQDTTDPSPMCTKCRYSL